MKTLLRWLRIAAAASILGLTAHASVARPDPAPGKSETGSDEAKASPAKDGAKAVPAAKGAVLVVALRSRADSATGAKPIAGATVYLKSKPEAWRATDTNGVAKLGDVTVGEVKIMVLVGVASQCTISLKVAGGEQKVEVEIPTACEAPH